MKIYFNIDYRTNWGESVYVTGNIPELGNSDESKALKLHIEGSQRWHGSIDIEPGPTNFEYRYIVRHDDGFVRHEWGTSRHCNIDPTVPEAVLLDSWRDCPADKPFYSSAFTECICRRPSSAAAPEPTTGKLYIKVWAPIVRPDEAVAIAGAPECLGEWDPYKAPLMDDCNIPEWSVELPISVACMAFEYKFLIVKKHTREIVAWEACDNRRFSYFPSSANATVVLSGLTLANPLAPWKGAGVAIPVFSIRSDDDFGVGDFYDLIKMADWASSTGQRFIQLLPINDTTMTGTWTDSYPYNANSTFALHPMYLRLQAMGTLNDPERQEYFDRLGHELNTLSEIDYERVNNGKTAFTRELFAQNGQDDLSSDEFRAFFDRNKHWLRSYAAFCVLRDLNGTPDMSQWGEYAEYSTEKVERLESEYRKDIDYVYYIQYHLDRQMRHARDYAHSRGIALKGDIPIGISRTSVDAWVSPRLFNLGCQAGAPPDDFSVLGQNWGFPTYNWEEMSHDGFAWWKSRFRKMAEYFDAYRIDHVLGFFRIWQIPMDAIHGLLGVFNPALPFTPDELKYNYDFWIDPDIQTRPYIMDRFLCNLFGRFTDEVRNVFLSHCGYGRYCLKPEFDTQRKVAAFFAHQPKNDKNDRICNGLMRLIDDVLFIEDPYEKGKYHPRISAQDTYIYRSLNDYEKWCFDRLYNDFYYHRHNDFWYGKAMWKLPPLIDATEMLVCGEDLGMIPHCVPDVMRTLEILSLEIQRMPKDPNTRFGKTWTYPYYSVCTTSTHDMGGIRQWWEEDPQATQAFYNEVLHEHGEAPHEATPWICDRIVSEHLASPSMLCILPLQDWLSIDGTLRRKDPREEQINVPANSRHYWRYRMHLTIEDLISQSGFNSRLCDKIAKSGR